MPYVDKVKKQDVTYDIQDARVPEVVEEDKGKFLHVNETTGALEFSNAGGDSVPIKVIDYMSAASGTYESLATALGITIEQGSNAEQAFMCTGKKDLFMFEYSWYGPLNIKLTTYSGDYIRLDTSNNASASLGSNYKDYQFNRNFLPTPGGEYSSRTGVLKVVNGTIQWVMEQV